MLPGNTRKMDKTTVLEKVIGFLQKHNGNHYPLSVFISLPAISTWRLYQVGFPGDSDGKESACSARGQGSIPQLGRSNGEGNGYPLQYCSLENSMDRMDRIPCSLVGYSPWGRKESDRPKGLILSLFSHFYQVCLPAWFSPANQTSLVIGFLFPTCSTLQKNPISSRFGAGHAPNCFLSQRGRLTGSTQPKQGSSNFGSILIKNV